MKITRQFAWLMLLCAMAALPTHADSVQETFSTEPTGVAYSTRQTPENWPLRVIFEIAADSSCAEVRKQALLGFLRLSLRRTQRKLLVETTLTTTAAPLLKVICSQKKARVELFTYRATNQEARQFLPTRSFHAELSPQNCGEESAWIRALAQAVRSLPTPSSPPTAHSLVGEKFLADNWRSKTTFFVGLHVGTPALANFSFSVWGPASAPFQFEFLGGYLGNRWRGARLAVHWPAFSSFGIEHGPGLSAGLYPATQTTLQEQFDSHGRRTSVEEVQTHLLQFRLGPSYLLRWRQLSATIGIGSGAAHFPHQVWSWNYSLGWNFEL